MVEKDILGTIVERKHEEVSSRRTQVSVVDLKAQIDLQRDPRPFVDAIKKRVHHR